MFPAFKKSTERQLAYAINEYVESICTEDEYGLISSIAEILNDRELSHMIPDMNVKKATEIITNLNDALKNADEDGGDGDCSLHYVCMNLCDCPHLFVTDGKWKHIPDGKMTLEVHVVPFPWYKTDIQNIVFDEQHSDLVWSVMQDNVINMYEEEYAQVCNGFPRLDFTNVDPSNHTVKFSDRDICCEELLQNLDLYCNQIL